ncbi:MAG: O-antigen ligase family protein [bacterium]|nr:O-antigen ligase family protein [bacterium]
MANSLVVKERILRWVGVLFIFALPFGTKKFLFPFAFPFTNAYVGEYASAFLYATDLFTLGLLVLAAFTASRFLGETFRRSWGAILLLVVALWSIEFAMQVPLGTYVWFRLFVGVVAMMAVASFIVARYLPLRTALGAFGASAVVQALIGLAQFYRGRSLGLAFLGESVVGETTKNVARVVIEGARHLRAYGTLPHANILAAFLITGLIALAASIVWNASERRWGRAALSGAGFLAVAAGLVVTFSRSGWIVAAVGIVGLLIMGITVRAMRRGIAVFAGVLVLTTGIVWAGLGWAIAPRADLSATEPSVAHRWIYDQVGVKTILERPFGVGIGNQLIEGVADRRYQLRGLTNPWEWQPIHNLYLMVGAELGVAGLVIFFIFLLWVFAVRKSPDDPFTNRVAALVLFSLLVFGLFDHFLWDLQAGRLLLWVAIGLCIGIRAPVGLPKPIPDFAGFSDRG